MTMPRWQKVALIAAGMLLLLAVFVAYLLPVIVISQAEQRVEAATGRKLEIGAMSFNPFTFVVVIDDFRFSEIGGKETFATFSRARIVVSPLSLFRRATIIDAAYITSPHFRIVRIGENNYNLSDLRKWLPLHPRLSVNNLTMTNGSVDFIDRALPAPQLQELRKIELSVPFITTMAYYSDRFITPRLSAELNGSPLQMEGKLRPFPRAVEATASIKVEELSLRPLLPYVPVDLPLRIESGRVSAQLALSYRASAPENPQLALSGSAILADMKFADRSGAPLLTVTRCDLAGHLDSGGPEGIRMEKLIVQAGQLFLLSGRGKGSTLAALSLNGGKFNQKEKRLEVAEMTLRDGDLRFSRDQGNLLPLKWELLQFDQLKGSLAPFTLDIGEVALTRFSSRVVVDKNGRLNLTPQEPAGKEQKGEERMIRIGAVTMQDGTLAFTDHHVPGGYSTTLYNLGGQISGLSAAKKSFADVDLHGSLEKRSPLRITGRINPLHDDFFADLNISFTAIELSPLTPYSVTYLGYAIDQGELFLNSNYLITNRKLDLENRARIAGLDFGKRSENENAISSSIQLAVALLKDQKGEIRFDFPVTGRTDDPHFSVRDLLLEILQNFLATAEDSPFSLLPSLSGTKEDWSRVGFASGSAELSPAEQEKLLKLATALNDRPALKIKVVGFGDRGEDDDSLRSLAEARAAGVRAFLIEQGEMDGARLLLERGDINRAAGSRVVFEVVVDD